jgi:Fe2+ transport system protein FeoA
VRIIEESLWEAPITVELDGARLAVPLGLARTVGVEALDG